jgi:PAS domain-containing protein
MNFYLFRIMNNFELDSMPGFISIIDLNLKYFAVNQKLADLFNLNKESVPGMPAGSKCDSQRQIIKNLVDSPLGTELNWECYYNEVCLFVCSKRQESLIFSQAIDITERKLLEENLKASSERNKILLKAIPDAVKFVEERRSTEQLEWLVKALVENPIVDQRKSIETLITLEVELREASVKLRQMEKIIYTDHNSFLNRLKAVEIYQEGDNEKWKDIEKIESLSRVSAIINNIPGGFRSWLIIFIVLQMVGIFCIDLGVRVFNLEEVIPIERINK